MNDKRLGLCVFLIKVTKNAKVLSFEKKKKITPICKKFVN